MSRDVSEADVAISTARAFGSEPPQWALDAVAASEAAAAGRPDYLTLFREAGLCEADAQKAARGLAQGLYFSFEDAAISMIAFDTQGRNLRATPRRIGEVARKVSRRGVIAEKRSPSQARSRVLEAGRGSVTGDGKLSICLIDAGQGSSGYYPTATLEEAGRAKVFPKGLQLFVDHPTETEDYERPERSVRDLAGVLATDATYRNGGLHAEATVFASHRQLITERASSIGVSIRAHAEVEQGQVGSYRGLIVKKITSAVSCDFVTQAGRGGRIVSVA